MKNIIVTVGMLFLMVMFISFQKDTSRLMLSNAKLQDVANDGAKAVAFSLMEGVSGQGKPDDVFKHFLEKNGYAGKVVNTEVKVDEANKKVTVMVDIGPQKYAMDFLNNEQHIVKKATCNI